MQNIVKIKELEEYFNKSLNELIEDNDILEVANDLDTCFNDYSKWEKENSIDLENCNEYLKSIKKDFYNWVENCNSNDLLNYDLETYQRHFKLENGKYYYLNSYI